MPMGRFLALVVLLAAPLLVRADNTPPSVKLTLSKATAAPGEEVKGTVEVTFAPGLHGYQNPPDPNYVLPVEVVAGEGTKLKSVSYPKGVKEVVAGVMSAVYTESVSFPVVLFAPTAPGPAKLNLTFKYQQCDDQTCYPPSTVALTTNLTVAGKTAPAPDAALGTVAPSQAKFDIEVPLKLVTVGTEYTVTLIVSPGRGLVLVRPRGAQSAFLVTGPGVLSSVSPAGKERLISGKSVTVYSRDVKVPVVLKAPNEPGRRDLEVEVSYTQADERQIFDVQTKTVRFSFEFVAPPVAIGAAGQEPPTTKVQQVTQPAKSGLEGFVDRALESGNWFFIIGAALLVGLALCLTPCVFPMIPVTVTYFANQGAKTNAGRFSLGLFYALGIAVTYGTVGGISAALGGAVGALFTKPWFVIALALLLVALALSMFDVWEIRLPGFIQRNLKGRSGPVGSLIMGLLMGFAAAPCAGALVGAFAAKVAQIGSVSTGVGFFATIGLGMGLPFMVLASMSSGAKTLPKSGAWLKTTKAVLGLVVLSIAAGYLFQGFGLKPDAATTKLAWIALYAAFAVYLLFFDRTDSTRAVAIIKGVACVAIGLFVGVAYSDYQGIRFQERLAQAQAGGSGQANGQIVGDTINWIPYNDKSFADAVASGKPIMIDGKADWCLRCHEIERDVFKSPEGLVALSGVYLMSIDWSTGVDPAYEKMTRERFKISGLPHVVFMGPGGKDEFSVNDITSVEELKQHLRKAGAKL